MLLLRSRVSAAETLWDRACPRCSGSRRRPWLPAWICPGQMLDARRCPLAQDQVCGDLILMATFTNKYSQPQAKKHVCAHTHTHAAGRMSRSVRRADGAAADLNPPHVTSCLCPCHFPRWLAAAAAAARILLAAGKWHRLVHTLKTGNLT